MHIMVYYSAIKKKAVNPAIYMANDLGGHKLSK